MKRKESMFQLKTREEIRKFKRASRLYRFMLISFNDVAESVFNRTREEVTFLDEKKAFKQAYKDLFNHLLKCATEYDDEETLEKFDIIAEKMQSIMIE